MENINLNKKELVKFGVTMGVALSVIAIFILIRHKHNGLAVAIIALTFFAISGVAPFLLKPVYRIWMLFSTMLGWVNTRFILTVIFYLLFTPIGLIIRLFGIDLLDRKIDKQKASYWMVLGRDASNYERQF
jgi:Saxitoxin biosynthesis operon protein SxtJ